VDLTVWKLKIRTRNLENLITHFPFRYDFNIKPAIEALGKYLTGRNVN
jgi:hypothetical protein